MTRITPFRVCNDLIVINAVCADSTCVRMEVFMNNKIISNKEYNKLIIILTLIYSLYLVGCSNVATNSDIDKRENEKLKLKNIELSEIINSYKSNDNMQDGITEKLRFAVVDILHVKKIGREYYIVLIVNRDDVKYKNVQLWKYSENAPSKLLAEGIDINIEIRNEYLYCTVLKSVGNDEYVEEVLKFDNESNQSQIYEGKNVEISVSPNGEYFIIIENPCDKIELNDMDFTNIRSLKILNENDKVIYDELIPSKLHTQLIPFGWNESKFWATLNYAGGNVEFLIFDTETFNYEIIENKADYVESELNMKTGWICYSDYPMLRDIDTYNEFSQSGTEVNLFVYNIFTNKKIKVATSIAKDFGPKWVDDYNFQYNDPNSGRRILYKLNFND